MLVCPHTAGEAPSVPPEGAVLRCGRTNHRLAEILDRTGHRIIKSIPLLLSPNLWILNDQPCPDTLDIS